MATSYWLENAPLILASGSETRALMLQSAGLKLQIIKPDVDERAIERPLIDAGATAEQISSALAKAKAMAISIARTGRWVLGADQTLDCKGEFYHKAESFADAKNQLAKLSGQVHRLTSAAALAFDGKIVSVCIGSAHLSMRQLEPEAVDLYLGQAGSTVMRSVGGYQLENLGIQLFEKIEGDHFTILGLPLIELLAEMRKLGLVSS